eukprot:GHVR01065105.1.p2 GENE.GHVR01065105.1~~GHVR01065105.1.p2  ORF type:complete len:124 (-),score=22.82 GHVR01065105.1:62-433(-)
MTTYKSSHDLALSALKKMNLMRPGEVPSTRTTEYLEEQWQEIHAELVDDSIAYWDADEIPMEVLGRCAWLLAVASAPGFGMLPIVLQAIRQPSAEDAIEALKSQLRKHVAQNATYEPIQIETY